MTRLPASSFRAALPVACTATLLSVATSAAAELAVSTEAEVHGAKLISFDGVHQLRAEASRQNLLAQKLGFRLTIDETGKPVDCELNRAFRRKATEIALCRPLLKYMKFEPARDESGKPYASVYRSVIDFRMSMGQDGYLVPEARN